MSRSHSILTLLAVVAVVASGGATAVALQDAPDVRETESTGATAQTAETWWDSDWQYKRQIDVSERAGYDLYDYPVLTQAIDIGSASPSSIRVVDESTGETLDFGVRETADGYRLVFKTAVEADGTNSDLAVYYGNPGAASVASPWNQVRYNFYDGFDDGTLDSEWSGDTDDWSESGGSLKPRGDGINIHRNLSQPLVQSDMPILWETRVISRSTGSGSDQRHGYLRNGDGDGHRLFFMRTLPNEDDGVGVNIGWDSPDSQKLLMPGQFSVDQPIHEEVLLRPNGDLDATAENEANGETGSRTYDAGDTYRYSQVALHDHGGKPGAEWDYIKIRYKVDPEPAVTVHAEQTRGEETTTTATTTAATTTTSSTCQPSDGEPSMQAVQLHTQDTEIAPDDPGHISGAIASDITNDCPVKVQITLQLPNGVRIGGGQNIQSGGGGLTTSTFVVAPGEVREISADVYSDDPGQKTVQASITYFPVGHKDIAKQKDGLTLSFDVIGGGATTDDASTEVTETTEMAMTTSTAEQTTARRDSDGDGVPDDVDYAPDDPSVQSKSDLQDDDGIEVPGFSVLSALGAVALAALLLGGRRE